MKNIFNILILSFLATISFAEISNPKGLFMDANNMYDSANYQDAAGVYQTLLDENYQSKTLHYNLANTYYKLGDLAKSILHYEKALKIAPKFKEAQINLEIARKSLIDKHEVSREGFVHWISSFIGFNTDFWAWLSIISLFVALLAFAFSKRMHKPLLKKVAHIKFIFFSVAFTLLLFLSFMKYQAETTHYAAIISTTSVTLKSEPNLASESTKVLHEGSKIIILAQSNGWVHARFGANEGWVEESSLSYI